MKSNAATERFRAAFPVFGRGEDANSAGGGRKAAFAGAVLLIRRMLRPVREAFEKQKRFVWDASHELKTPLAVIAANADVLAGEVGESLSYIRA